MLSRLALILPLLTASVAAVAAQGLAQIVSYTSSLDNSSQQYGVYLPQQPAPSAAGYPAILHTHGYGWSVGAGFSDFQTQWAERHGWVLINLNARGPQFYEGVGDTETHKVIRDANARFGLDLSRLFITGGSMGGTGAFRLGIRYPNVFAAAVGVDGWSDFREWHRHWYARTDMPDDIEEFRRPLLEACSPLYWTGRSRWGQVQASVSGKDDVVLPVNGLSLHSALVERANNMPGAYESRLFLDEAAGHGGSTRMDQIYAFFANRAALADPGSFLCESSILTHSNLYWGSMERLTVQGAFAALESDTAGSVVTVLTRNLSQFAIHLQVSPVATRPTVSVYADGFPCYQGKPRTVHLQADFSPTGQLWGWHEIESAGLRKTPALEGPLGEAFKVPFVVVYGTAGSTAQTARNLREASDFARGWNAQMVHGEAVVPLAEGRLDGPSLQSRSLIVFGTETDSHLLQQANANHELPVHVLSDGIVVDDPQWGDREYRGSQFGTFACFPNPLSDFRTYLVVCRGQFATKPDGSALQGLEYDLEKLPWAYPDYVVFNSNQRELPHVLSVNNKPPVTCYEAGYFVEAGYFDQDWRPYRSATLDRLNALRLPVRQISVASLSASDEGVRVRVVTTKGEAVKQARVTVRFAAQPPRAQSAVTDDGGTALFPWPVAAGAARPECRVVNVLATAAEYDFGSDVVRSTADCGVGLIASGTPADENGRCNVSVTVSAESATTVTATVTAPGGLFLPAQQTVPITPGQPRRLSFAWANSALPPGRYRAQVLVQASEPRVSVSRTVYLQVGRWPTSPLRITEVKAVDIPAGKPWQVTVRLLNTGPETVSTALCCALLEDRQYLPPRKVTVRPGEELTVTFDPAKNDPPLPVGMHTVRISAPRELGVLGSADFSVK